MAPVNIDYLTPPQKIRDLFFSRLKNETGSLFPVVKICEDVASIIQEAAELNDREKIASLCPIAFEMAKTVFERSAPGKRRDHSVARQLARAAADVYSFALSRDFCNFFFQKSLRGDKTLLARNFAVSLCAADLELAKMGMAVAADELLSHYPVVSVLPYVGGARKVAAIQNAMRLARRIGLLYPSLVSESLLDQIMFWKETWAEPKDLGRPASLAGICHKDLSRCLQKHRQAILL